MSELTKFIIGLTHQQSYSGYSQLTRDSKCLLPTGQQKYWKTLPWTNGDMSKASKTQPVLAQEGCPSKASRSPGGQMGRFGSRQMKKTAQSRGAVNEVEAEQVTSSVATETDLDRLIEWRRCNTFNRIRNFIAYCMRFKTKQKGTLKADEIHQLEKLLFRFFQTESFPNVSKSIARSKEISKTLNIAKLSPFIEEDGTIRVKAD